MKRAILLTMFGLLLLVQIRSVEAYDCATADGSELEPYCIFTIEDLDNVRNNLTANYILKNDLDFDEVTDYENAANQATFTTGSGFEPIGQWPDVFDGNFDGDGFTISNLYINRAGDSDVGLFSFISYNSNVSITNLTLEDVYVYGNSNVGALVGLAWDTSTISNISVSGQVLSLGSAVGGVIGTISNSTLTDIVNNASVTSSSYSSYQGSGGVIGYLFNSTLSNVINNGDVVVNGYRVGGVVGIAKNSTIDYAVNTGLVDSNHHTSGATGGISGKLENSSINHAYSTGDVESKGWVGGLVGQNDATSSTSNSYTIGDVTNTGTNYYGKFSGFSSMTTSNSFYFDFQTLTTPYSGPTVVGTEATFIELSTVSWQENVLGADDTDMWDFTQIISGNLPKLMNSTKTQLLPGQVDVAIEGLVFYGVVDTDVSVATQGTEVVFTVTFNNPILGTPTIELQGAEIVPTSNLSGSGNIWTFTHTIEDGTEGSIDAFIDATNTDGEDVIASLQLQSTGLVIDDTAPVISFDGASILTNDAMTFTPNATALDTVSGDVTTSITYLYYDIDNNLLADLDAARNLLYTGESIKISATALDDVGNSATSNVVTFTHIDNTPPSFNEIGTQSIQAGDFTNVDWTTYITNQQDNISDIFTSSETVDTIVYDTVGEYQVTVSLMDEAMNVTTETFTVNVVDNTVPNIIVVGSNPTTFELGSNMPDFTSYFTLTDNNETITVSTELLDISEVDMDQVGTFDVHITYSDGFQSSSETITITIEDTTAPIINMDTSAVVIEYGDIYTHPTCTVTDLSSNSIECLFTGTVDVNTLGDYTIYVNAKDISNNEATEQSFIVQVVDTTDPVINVSKTTYTIERGTDWTNPNCTVSDNVDTDLTCNFSGSVDSMTSGEYFITISAQDKKQNEATTVILTVTVEDTIAPIVEGVEDDKLYDRGSSVTITFNEGSATLNGKDFESGDSINEKGTYNLIVTDIAGNVTTVHFEIQGTNVVLIVVAILSLIGISVAAFFGRIYYLKTK